MVVLKARNLPRMDISGFSGRAGLSGTLVTIEHADPYVKIYLVQGKVRLAKKKTHIKKRTLNPVFNESFVFELPSEAGAISSIQLQFVMLDWDRVTKNEVSILSIFFKILIISYFRLSGT